MRNAAPICLFFFFFGYLFCILHTHITFYCLKQVHSINRDRNYLIFSTVVVVSYKVRSTFRDGYVCSTIGPESACNIQMNLFEYIWNILLLYCDILFVLMVSCIAYCECQTDMRQINICRLSRQHCLEHQKSKIPSFNGFGNLIKTQYVRHRHRQRSYLSLFIQIHYLLIGFNSI